MPNGDNIIDGFDRGITSGFSGFASGMIYKNVFPALINAAEILPTDNFYFYLFSFFITFVPIVILLSTVSEGLTVGFSFIVGLVFVGFFLNDFGTVIAAFIIFIFYILIYMKHNESYI
ncbi:MAG: hypothetical protein ACLFMM_07400 [Methanohalobium sp.]|uniref:hypothetical protein n=1 Tax=Methanohalobium sp. TaxID=2837493 RepID=UPI00397A378B